MMLFSTSCNLTSLCMYFFTRTSIDHPTINWMKCASLMRWSTIIHITLLPLGLRDNVIMKFLVTFFHFHSGMGNDWSKESALWYSTFNLLTYQIFGYKFSILQLHPTPPKVLLQFSIYLRSIGMNRIKWTITSKSTPCQTSSLGIQSQLTNHRDPFAWMLKYVLCLDCICLLNFYNLRKSF